MIQKASHPGRPGWVASLGPEATAQPWGSEVAGPAVPAALQPAGAPKELPGPLPSPSLSSAFSFSLCVSAFPNCHLLTVEHSGKGAFFEAPCASRNVLTEAAGVADGEATKLRSLNAEHGLFCERHI